MWTLQRSQGEVLHEQKAQQFKTQDQAMGKGDHVESMREKVAESNSSVLFVISA